MTRAIGLTNNIRAYALQDHGHDTIEANRLLGFDDDERDYRAAAQMLEALGMKSVRLMTSNPAKLRGLREHGVQVMGASRWSCGFREVLPVISGSCLSD